AHAVAILGPGAIVVAHVVTEDLLQREPGMRGTLADPAVGDHGLAAVDAHRGVDLAQLVLRLERAVGGDRLPPGHVHRAGNVARSHGELLYALRREDLAVVFVRGADVDELRVAALLRGGEHVGQAGAQGGIGRLHGDVAGRLGSRPDVQRTLLGFPL